MKAVLEIELFGEDIRGVCKVYNKMMNGLMPGLGDNTIGSIPPSGWIAEITGTDMVYKYRRNFLKRKIDYSRANSNGSGGVFAEYILESGKYYEVSIKKSNRYFCTVDTEGNIIRIETMEIERVFGKPALEQPNCARVRGTYYAFLGMIVYNPPSPQQIQTISKLMTVDYEKIIRCVQMMIEKLPINDILKSFKNRRFQVASTPDIIHIGFWRELERAITSYNLCADIIKAEKITYEFFLEGVKIWLKSHSESMSLQPRDNE